MQEKSFESAVGLRENLQFSSLLIWVPWLSFPSETSLAQARNPHSLVPKPTQSSYAPMPKRVHSFPASAKVSRARAPLGAQRLSAAAFRTVTDARPSDNHRMFLALLLTLLPPLRRLTATALSLPKTLSTALTIRCPTRRGRIGTGANDGGHGSPQVESLQPAPPRPRSKRPRPAARLQN